jgi:hypothetical protein
MNRGKADFAYCGLNRATCRERFVEIRGKIVELDIAFNEADIEAMAKAVPFMNARYQGYRKMAAFFKNECPGCGAGGGNPFRGIRKCAKKRNYHTCIDD